MATAQSPLLSAARVEAWWARAHCALEVDGTVWCWGANSLGQLGDNSTTARGFPVPLAPGAPSFAQISVGAGKKSSTASTSP